MSPGRQVTFFASFRWFSLPVLLLFVIASCTTPKRYQKDKPFVYKTSITINGDFGSSEKAKLKSDLANQLDDSVKVRTVLAVGFPSLFYYRLSKPPVFDTLNVDRSKTFMNALLTSQGYFYPIITDTFSIDTVRDQQRVTVKFFVSPGKVHRLDSINWILQTPELQQLALQNRDQTLLRKNDPYSLQKVSAELDRLLTIFRDNGYYRITKEDVFAEQDTVSAGLIDPTLDLFEQARLLEELQRRRENPTINVVIKQRNMDDTSHLQRFYIGNVAVYPDLPILEDSPQVQKFSDTIRGYKFFYSTRRFKLPFIARNISLVPGELYKQTNYFKTINTFTSLGAWQQVDIDLFERYDSTPLLDANIRLYPGKKYILNADFETSRNASDVLTTGSLFGIGVNVGLRNRNAFRESIQTSTNARFGVELGTNIVQTVQTSLAHSIYIPRFIKPSWLIKKDSEVVAPRTVINFNASYTNRREFFAVRSFNTSFGYDWSKKKHTYQLIPFNFEFTKVDRTDSLNKLAERIPTLKQAFNDGLIIEVPFAIGAYTYGTTIGNRVKFFRARIESSGLFLGLFRGLDKADLRRFIKLDTEFKYFINYTKSSWAFRIFGGYGHAYGKAGDSVENNLPFFKAFFAGGPYSMRAWQVRRLGPGSSNVYDNTVVTDRFGDMQLEGNIEYRFNLATIAGVKVKSALFVDVGNIWAKTIENDVRIKEAEFNFGRLYKDLAVGSGTSLRFDFDFFLIRFDWAYKIKNPLYSDTNSGWFQNIDITDGQFQLGIGYPF